MNINFIYCSERTPFESEAKEIMPAYNISMCLYLNRQEGLNHIADRLYDQMNKPISSLVKDLRNEIEQTLMMVVY